MRAAERAAEPMNRNARLRQLAEDPNLGRADRAWIQEQIKRRKPNLKNPPGKELCHRRGFERAKGYGYEHADIRNAADHRIQHHFDNMGRNNKDMGNP
jgi:hypothetical protein